MDETKVIQAMLFEFEKEKALSNRALKQLPRGDLRITRNGPGCKIIYHEHAGLKTQEYRDGLMDKLQLYASAGIRLGDNLILTFDDEKGGINLQLVEERIRDRYFS